MIHTDKGKYIRCVQLLAHDMDNITDSAYACILYLDVWNSTDLTIWIQLYFFYIIAHCYFFHDFEVVRSI